jgi:hypothetical protein
MGWKYFPNLAKRPHAPAKGRGRLQRQVRRALIVHGPLVTTSQLLDWAYARKRRRPTGWDHSKVMRICAEHLRSDWARSNNREAVAVAIAQQQS